MFFLTTLNTHFIRSFSVSISFKQSKHALNIDIMATKRKQNKHKKRFKATKNVSQKTCFFYISITIIITVAPVSLIITLHLLRYTASLSSMFTLFMSLSTISFHIFLCLPLWKTVSKLVMELVYCDIKRKQLIILSFAGYNYKLMLPLLQLLLVLQLLLQRWQTATTTTPTINTTTTTPDTASYYCYN